MVGGPLILATLVIMLLVFSGLSAPSWGAFALT